MSETASATTAAAASISMNATSITPRRDTCACPETRVGTNGSLRRYRPCPAHRSCARCCTQYISSVPCGDGSSMPFRPTAAKETGSSRPNCSSSPTPRRSAVPPCTWTGRSRFLAPSSWRVTAGAFARRTSNMCIRRHLGLTRQRRGRDTSRGSMPSRGAFPPYQFFRCATRICAAAQETFCAQSLGFSRSLTKNPAPD